VVRKQVMVRRRELKTAEAPIQAVAGVAPFDLSAAGDSASDEESNVGNYFAIVLDGKVISAAGHPRCHLRRASGQISGKFHAAKRTRIWQPSEKRRTSVPLKIIEARSVGPIGARFDTAGIYACCRASPWSPNTC